METLEQNYASSKYWDQRYEQRNNAGTTFEWLENWNELQSMFKKMRVDGFYHPSDQIDDTKVELVIKSEMYD